jgi:hypothetical protein
MLAIIITILIHVIPASMAWVMGGGNKIDELPSFIQKISLIESGCYIDSHCNEFGECTEGGAWICEPRLLIYDFWEKAIAYFITYLLIVTFAHIIFKKVQNSSTTPNRP